MNRRMPVLFSLLVVSLFLFGFEGKVFLGEYKAKNAEEEKIIETLTNFEEAYNKHNLDGALSHCSATVKIMPCAEFVQVSKEDFIKRFPSYFYIFPSYAFYNPEIQAFGSKAKLNMQLETGIWLLDYKVNMVKEKEIWLIEETSWENLRLK